MSSGGSRIAPGSGRAGSSVRRTSTRIAPSSTSARAVSGSIRSRARRSADRTWNGRVRRASVEEPPRRGNGIRRDRAVSLSSDISTFGSVRTCATPMTERDPKTARLRSTYSARGPPPPSAPRRTRRAHLRLPAPGGPSALARWRLRREGFRSLVAASSRRPDRPVTARRRSGSRGSRRELAPGQDRFRGRRATRLGAQKRPQ